MGNTGVLLRAYIYARLLGAEGMTRVAEFATLNSNYLMTRLRDHGFDLAYTWATGVGAALLNNAGRPLPCPFIGEHICVDRLTRAGLNLLRPRRGSCR